MSTELGDRLYQHTRDQPRNGPLAAEHHGWQGVPFMAVLLAGDGMTKLSFFSYIPQAPIGATCMVPDSDRSQHGRSAG